MLTDGIRLQNFFANARDKIVICAPFIKVHTLRSLLKKIPNEIDVEIYTRWKPHEILLGVSDLAVFDYVSSLNRGRVFISDRLHAKFYRSDSSTIIGSANVTNSALGWSKNPNIEFLVKVDSSCREVQVLESELARFQLVTPETRLHFENLVNELDDRYLPTIKDQVNKEEALKSRYVDWLPACTVPDILYAVYSDEFSGRRFSSGAIADALSDLDDLGVPPGLDKMEFEILIKDRLRQIDSFKAFLDRASSVLVESDALKIIKVLRPDYLDEEAKFFWNIILEWIRVFFHEEIEIAPLSFEIRIRR